MKKKAAWATGIAISMAALPTAVLAADDVFTIDVGGYRFNARNDVRVDGLTRRGTDFRFERVGTPENDTVLRLDGTIRPFERHRIRFMYLDSTRSGSTTIDRDIAFRDSFVPAGSSVSSRFSARQIELDYMYSFWKTETTEVALSLGVHSTEMKARIDSPAVNVAAEASATGPLPMIGIAATTKLGQKWELLGHIYGMAAQVGGLEGSALAYRVGGRYFITPNIGIGLAWAGIRYDFDVNKTRWNGQLDATNNGGELFLTLRF